MNVEVTTIKSIDGINTTWYSCDYELGIKGDWRKLRLTGSFLGCGVAGLTSLWDFLKKDEEELPTAKCLLEKAKQLALKEGCGAIFYVLGQPYWDPFHEKLLALGFMHSATYHNPQHEHGGKYMQRLYILKTK